MMRVILIDMNGVGPIFVTERSVEDLAAETGWRGRVLGWPARAFLSLTKVPGRFGAFLGWIWGRLQSQVAPDEDLLRQLRHTSTLVIDHPARMTSDEVASIWSHRLGRRVRTHAFWFTINATVAIPATVLAILPGPNLLGYWVGYRAVIHLFAMLGAHRGRRLVAVFVPNSELDITITTIDDGQIAEIAARLQIPTLATLLAPYEGPTEAPS